MEVLQLFRGDTIIVRYDLYQGFRLGQHLIHCIVVKNAATLFLFV
jgi:hypothetical protein